MWRSLCECVADLKALHSINIDTCANNALTMRTCAESLATFVIVESVDLRHRVRARHKVCVRLCQQHNELKI